MQKWYKREWFRRGLKQITEVGNQPISFHLPDRVSLDFAAAIIVVVGGTMALLLHWNAELVEQEQDALLHMDWKDTVLETKVRRVVNGSPIERMVPYIASLDRTTAAFLVGVAKKESNWGKRVPRRDGKDCFNYWGYRGGGDEVTWDGYSCFKTREEAVQTVGGRMHELVHRYDLDTPREFVVWKCGFNCAGHSPKSVEKWIRDVDIYYRKVKEAPS